jgi:hypothetical protein
VSTHQILLTLQALCRNKCSNRQLKAWRSVENTRRRSLRWVKVGSSATRGSAYQNVVLTMQKIRRARVLQSRKEVVKQPVRDQGFTLNRILTQNKLMNKNQRRLMVATRRSYLMRVRTCWRILSVKKLKHSKRQFRPKLSWGQLREISLSALWQKSTWSSKSTINILNLSTSSKNK